MKKGLFFLTIIIMLFSACSKDNKLEEKYFVSILPQKYFVERIVGDMFQLEVLVKPGDSPATYELTTKQLIDLSNSKALFTIGVAFEENLIPKLQKQYPQLNVVATDKRVKKHRPSSFIQLFEEDNNHSSYHQHHQSDNKHSHEGLDPHIWLSPDLVKIQINDIADYFIQAYPEKASYFIQNRDDFSKDLDEVSLTIDEIFTASKSREFLCFHPAWGYFADQFQLKQIPIEIEGKEPTPKEQQKILEFARAREIKAIFVQTQFDQRIASSIAQQIGGSVISIDPLAEDYLNNIKHIASKLAESMGK